MQKPRGRPGEAAHRSDFIPFDTIIYLTGSVETLIVYHSVQNPRDTRCVKICIEGYTKPMNTPTTMSGCFARDQRKIFSSGTARPFHTTRPDTAVRPEESNRSRRARRTEAWNILDSRQMAESA